MSDDQILDAFSRVRSWTRGDHRAPHKPLLLLIALAALRRRERWLYFADVEVTLRDLLLAFGPFLSAPRPEYPFWRLQSDGIWIVPEADVLQPRVNAAGDVSAASLRVVNARGGFHPEVFSTLSERPDLVNLVAARILDDSLPPTLHEQVLDAIGFPWTVVTRRRRVPGFRDEVLRIYERRCAVCGYDGCLGGFDLAIEACHIKWHSAGGPDSPDNGIALCSFHHVALDRGALTMNEEYMIQVSQHVSGQSHVDALLVQYAGRPLRPPQAGIAPPSNKYLDWHRRWVFRPPSRAA